MILDSDDDANIDVEAIDEARDQSKYLILKSEQTVSSSFMSVN